MYIITGILGFIACCLFDINKIKWNMRVLNLFFALGSNLLIVSTLWCILRSDFSLIFSDFGPYRIAMLACAILSIAAEVYAMFFALPFEETYMESSQVPVVDRGWYRACRHPGFWTLSLAYLFLWLFTSNVMLLYALIAYTICNFIYILVQDIYIFPRYIRGYDDYRNTVPFLIPNRESIREAFSRNKS